MGNQRITRSEIEAYEKLYRVNLINSLPGCKSLNLIGTVDSNNQTNLAIVSTVTHLGSNPPLLGYVSRPHSVERHTLSNILETGHYTVNQVNGSIYQQAHQTSARYPREQSEFTSVGLTPVWNDDIPAPMVEQSSVSIHLKLAETVDLKLNDTVLVIGEVMDIIVQDELIGADGNINLETADAVAGSGLDGYYAIKQLERLPYAKP